VRCAQLTTTRASRNADPLEGLLNDRPGMGEHRVRHLAWLAVASVVAGCSGDPRSETPAFELVDSAGVAIATSNRSMALAPKGWRVSEEPDLILGLESSESGFFHQVQGVAGFDDGRILVVDGGSRELRFFDESGVLVSTAGGDGEGPGEFRNPVLVPQVGLDSIVIFDRGLVRVSVLSEAGEFSRVVSFRHGRPRGSRAPVGAVGLRHFLMDRRGTEGGPETPTPDEGLVRAIRGFEWYDRTDGARVPTDTVVANFIYYERGSMSWLLPFVPEGSAATTESGAYVTLGPEIVQIDTAGTVLSIFRVDGLGRPYNDDDLRAYAEFMREERPSRHASSNAGDWKDQLRRHGGPDSVPAFDALLLDTEGHLWARTYQVDPQGEQTWLIFDAAGRALGSVVTPGGLEVRWIGRDTLLGIRRDEYDVEYVYRHTLEAGGEEAL